MASSINRTDTPSALDATLDSLIPASCRILSSRWTSRVRSVDLRLAIPGQVTQLSDRFGRHERGAHHAMLHQLAQPRRVGHVGLAAGQVARVPGVEQPAFDAVFQHLPSTCQTGFQ
jgi:hypothetical protein